MKWVEWVSYGLIFIVLAMLMLPYIWEVCLKVGQWWKDCNDNIEDKFGI